MIFLIFWSNFIDENPLIASKKYFVLYLVA
jgi:hypothetical protein